MAAVDNIGPVKEQVLVCTRQRSTRPPGDLADQHGEDLLVSLERVVDRGYNAGQRAALESCICRLRIWASTKIIIGAGRFMTRAARTLFIPTYRCWHSRGPTYTADCRGVICLFALFCLQYL